MDASSGETGIPDDVAWACLTEYNRYLLQGGTRLAQAAIAPHYAKNDFAFHRGVTAGAYTATGLQ
jgi:hypothetical protein